MNDQDSTLAQLETFSTVNALAKIELKEDFFIINTPWGRSDALLKASINDVDFVSMMNNLRLDPRFAAIIHTDRNLIEFIYSFLDPEDDDNKGFINRRFTFHFDGAAFDCYFEPPTERLFKLAECYEELIYGHAIGSAPQLEEFKDFKNLTALPSRIQAYFSGKEPRSFFVKSSTDLGLICLESLAQHINFLMSYYDRRSPYIEIKPQADEVVVTPIRRPVRYIQKTFPTNLVSPQIDEIILKLMTVASSSESRFSFLYYYQVFEYAGYSYVNEKAKIALRKFIKDPALVNCSEDKVAELFGMLREGNQSDDVKMRHVIEEQCDPKVLWVEIENDRSFFSKEQIFEGGFVAKALISEDTTESSWCAMWTPKVFDQLTKIRNCLVHAREKREDKVILPTRINSFMLGRYVPLIRRMAEEIAIRS